MSRQYLITTQEGSEVVSGNTRRNAITHWVWNRKAAGIKWRLQISRISRKTYAIEAGTVYWPWPDPFTEISFTIEPYRGE